jgi:hypothetical protein
MLHVWHIYLHVGDLGWIKRNSWWLLYRGYNGLVKHDCWDFHFFHGLLTLVKSCAPLKSQFAILFAGHVLVEYRFSWFFTMVFSSPLKPTRGRWQAQGGKKFAILLLYFADLPPNVPGVSRNNPMNSSPFRSCSVPRFGLLRPGCDATTADGGESSQQAPPFRRTQGTSHLLHLRAVTSGISSSCNKEIWNMIIKYYKFEMVVIWTKKLRLVVI